uniref:Vomeronasal type-1 receptor n=1 Tax=Microcebus ravelobensis TaxID=122231 RepID=A0A1P8NUY9_MICRA|nr:vomeronasal 1 receptor VN1R-Mmur041 [Microcebus ravelobensis]APX52395.1 vomeronasal 1 receptor VN1R-Mmur041 [Microcebus ravelobensis]APX52396.1 vomeronasal 1 receptor VN1R-Mmur041 [Microcebus ravelobensis]APX52397.1 vomeronasal 1 receptor VN1R-Mmur041 [Microcebus ravelobensis]APX52400.1 vomeronasal 1 receptor VN1R-Mmur041 [Microcebus ravelobensis]
MIASDTILGFVLVSQISVGFIGNSLLFVFYVYMYFIHSHLRKPIDLIFMHLTLVNVLSILFSLTPHIMTYFGVRNAMTDVSCKAILYINRVIRALSICTTSLMSTFQAITISPSNAKWAWLKSRLSTCISPSFLFFWILNMLVYIHLSDIIVATTNVTVAGAGYRQVYCQSNIRKLPSQSFLSALLIKDFLFVVLMVCTSLYMVSVLRRHHRRAQHLHSPSLSAQLSPENKATHSILALVSCFVLFYGLNSVITLYIFYTPRKNPKLYPVTVMLSSCYPTLCPFVLMKNSKIISHFYSSFP